jgi:hypothetical protein
MVRRVSITCGVPKLGHEVPNALIYRRNGVLAPHTGNDDFTAIFVAGLSRHGLKRITPWGSYADKIDCSPDGRRIVFSN